MNGITHGGDGISFQWNNAFVVISFDHQVSMQDWLKEYDGEYNTGKIKNCMIRDSKTQPWHEATADEALMILAADTTAIEYLNGIKNHLISDEKSKYSQYFA